MEYAMPDFSLEGCHEYWAEFSDPMVYKALCFMESVETWAIDEDENIDDIFTELGSALENIDNIDLGEQDKFIAISAHVKATRNLRLLQTLDSAYPGAVSKLLAHAEEESANNETADLFLRRNVTFERLRLLGRVFSHEKLETMKNILEENKHA